VKIGTRLALGFLLMLLLMVSMAVLLVAMNQKAMEDSIGGNTAFLTRELFQRMNQYIYDKLELLQVYSRKNILRDMVSESNREMEGIPDLEGYLRRMDERWVATPPGAITPFMQGILENRLSANLKDDLMEFYENRYGYPIFGELFVTNKYGAIVALTDRTSNYWRAPQRNWAITREAGWLVSDITYDESAAIYGLRILVRVDDNQGRFIGTIVGILNISDVISRAQIGTKNYKTTEIRLITNDGKLIYATMPFTFLEDVSDKGFYRNIRSGSGYFIIEEGGTDKLFSYAHPRRYYDYPGLDAILLVAYDTQEVLAPIYAERRIMAGATLLFIVVSMFIVFVMTISLDRPIKRLTQITGEAVSKNLDIEIDPILLERKDELGSLSVAFQRMIRQIKDAQERLVHSEKLALMGKLAGGIAHELRNPLGGIRNAAYFLKMELEKTDPEVQESIEIIEKEVNTSEKIINSILSFARPSQPIKHRIDVNDAVREAISRISVPDNITVDARWGASPVVLADSAQLDQAFRNIIRNAIQAMPDGGCLTIRTATKNNGFVHVVIGDTGIGIPDKDIDKIFEPLYTTKARGVGLGLALTRMFVEAHGGTIEVKSRVGKGSSFTVRLPAGLKREQ
jgi:signal transduction histidine kinase